MAASLDFSNDEELEFPLPEDEVGALLDAVLSRPTASGAESTRPRTS